MSQNTPNIIIFADGSKDGWWSGARKLLERIQSWELKANVVKIISWYSNGGVKELTREFGVGFEYVGFPKRIDEIINGEKTGRKVYTEKQLEEIQEMYRKILQGNNWDYIFLSGWMRYVLELPSNKTVNIHPVPTQWEFGWKGMYGDTVHQKVWEKYQDWEVSKSAITMHYVTEKFDDGPIICQIPVNLDWIAKWEDIKERTNKWTEHAYQWIITRLITEGKIMWSWIQGEAVIWDLSITPEYMRMTFGVEWKTEWQKPLEEFEKLKEKNNLLL